MDMRITSTTKKTKPNGVIRGSIMVQEGKRRWRVCYEKSAGGYAEQWGASTEVLCFTYPTFERLINDE